MTRLSKTDPFSELPAPVLEQAIAWQVKLLSGTATHEIRKACEQWRTAHPDHDRAWQALQQLDSRFTSVAAAPSGLAKQTLYAAQQQPHLSRRQTVKMLLLGGLLIPAGAAGLYHSPLVQPEYRVATGQRQGFTLADGSRLQLNSRSAADVQLTEQATQVVLRQGDLYLDTRQQWTAVASTQVQVRGWQMTLARGEYLIHQRDEQLYLHAIQGELLAEHPRWGRQAFSGGSQAWWLDARDAQGWQPYQDVRFDPAAWLQGALVARQMPLAHFLAELGRYREGWIRSAPELQDLLVSGVFQIADTDLALQALEQTLPLKIKAFMPYLVTLVPA